MSKVIFTSQINVDHKIIDEAFHPNHMKLTSNLKPKEIKSLLNQSEG